MKRLGLLIGCALWVQLGSAQVADDFSDGDFTTNPAWLGDQSLFSASTQVLLSAGPAQADTASLATAFSPSLADTIRWQWWWSLDFAPSDNNQSRVYLLASHIPFHTANCAYYLRLGNSGNDSLRLYKTVNGTATLLAAGAVDFSTASAARVEVTRWPNGEWQLSTDAAGGNTFVLDFIVTDTQSCAGEWFGPWCKYTSSNADGFAFDEFLITATLIVDTAAPIITATEVLDSITLRITFNEPIDTATLVASQVSVDQGVGSAASIAFVSATVLVAHFSNAFPSATACTLSLSAVSDNLGNAAAASAIFTHFNFATPEFGSLIINEIMADPSPPVALPEVEYLEVLNTTNDYIALANLSVSDGSTTGTYLGTEVLAPGAYVLLCHVDDAGLFTGVHVLAMPSFPGINNDGDVLTLSQGATLLDEVEFDPSWYAASDKDDGGYSLELRNPYSPCSGRHNWGASVAAAGGTPGLVNSLFTVAPDTVLPSILAAVALDAITIEIQFSEAMDTAATVQAQLSGGYSASVSVVEPDRLLLSVSPPLELGRLVALEIMDATDCAGNSLAGSWSVGLPKTPERFELVVTEIHARPTDQTALAPVEYVELHNRSGWLIGTGGLQLTDGSTTASLPIATLLPGAFAVICNDDNAALFAGVNILPTTSFPSLNNSGDLVKLTLDGSEIDEVHYADLWFESTDGVALERVAIENLCGQRNNWALSTAAKGGTPGAPNSVNNVDYEAASARLLAIQFADSQHLSFLFDRRMDTLAVFATAAAADNETLNWVSHSGAEKFKANIDQPMARGELHNITLGEVADCSGQTVAVPPRIAYYPKPAEVVLNEVLFNPVGDGSDYVELTNVAPYPVELMDWQWAEWLADSVAFSPIAEGSFELMPGAFVAFATDTAMVSAQFKVGENLLPSNLVAMNNDGGEVLLADAGGTLMDSLRYSDSLHHPLVENADGVSLERVSATTETRSDGNWQSASAAVGYGTPAAVNSQEFKQPDEQVPAIIWLGNTRLSPDADGFEDVLPLLVESYEAGGVLNVSIYTQGGQLVSNWLDGYLVGNGAEVFWNGARNDGSVADVGVYVALAEVFYPSGVRVLKRLPFAVVRFAR